MVLSESEALAHEIMIKNGLVLIERGGYSLDPVAGWVGRFVGHLGPELRLTYISDDPADRARLMDDLMDDLMDAGWKPHYNSWGEREKWYYPDGSYIVIVGVVFVYAYVYDPRPAVPRRGRPDEVERPEWLDADWDNLLRM